MDERVAAACRRVDELVGRAADSGGSGRVGLTRPAHAADTGADAGAGGVARERRQEAEPL
eukprot:3846444-Prymnesium_polylepis.1